jgi:hypothetical protein
MNDRIPLFHNPELKRISKESPANLHEKYCLHNTLYMVRLAQSLYRFETVSFDFFIIKFTFAALFGFEV